MDYVVLIGFLTAASLVLHYRNFERLRQLRDEQAIGVCIACAYVGAGMPAVSLYGWRVGLAVLVLAAVVVHVFISGILWLIRDQPDEQIELFVHPKDKTKEELLQSLSLN